MNSLFAIAIGYVCGCFSTAYYLVRWRTGQDIRTLGSGTAGAKNTGRILGPVAFAVVMLVDMAKGYLTVWIAYQLGVAGWAVILAYSAVILGHLFPAQLGFRGGKGVATAFGGVLAFDPLAGVVQAVIAGVAFAITRAFTLSGLISIVCAPFVALLLGLDVTYIVASSVGAVILLVAHRSNIREIFGHAESHRAGVEKQSEE